VEGCIVNDQLLEIDVRLLLLRYGRQKVLQALARFGNQSLEELEQQLLRAEQRRTVKRPRPSIIEMVATECRERPDIIQPMKALVSRFQNRTFLPQLRDVQRFLDRAHTSQGKVKSRTTAAPTLIRTLATLPRTDLLRLAAEHHSPEDSDYDLLARAIMGKPAKGPGWKDPESEPTET
jgi:hypothetical protein